MIHPRQFMGAAILAGLLAGCATPPSTSVPPPVVDAAELQRQQLAAMPTILREQAILEELESAQTPTQAKDAIALAQRFPITRTSSLYLPFVQAQARAFNLTQAYDESLSLISATLSDIQLPIRLPQEIALTRLKIQAQDALGQDVSSLKDLIYLSALEGLDQLPDNQADIWQRAQLAADIELDDQRSEFNGWIALAQVLNQPNPEQAMRLWLTQWRDHSANLDLPGEVANLLDSSWPVAGKVGAILPLSGPLQSVGQSLLDGLIEQQLDSNSGELVIVDGTEGVSAALAKLNDAGVEIIVGPLPKEQVSELFELKPVQAVLSLNYLDQITDASSDSARFMMGLAPEDNARDAARLMAAQSIERPLLLVPGDQLGERVVAAFSKQWAQHAESQPIIQTYLNDDQRQIVSQALGVSESQTRHRNLEQQLGIELEFTPRRRQDIGSVYIYGDSIASAQLKPLLAFYYAGDLPAWIADVALDQNLDLVRQDLNGAYLVAMPWQLDNPSGNVLYQLGRDAWSLSQNLDGQLQAEYPGATGNWFKEGAQLRRKLQPALITQDQIRPILRIEGSYLSDLVLPPLAMPPDLDLLLQ